jgi:ATP-binding cassette subfamily B (MDR/TAP) protein 1
MAEERVAKASAGDVVKGGKEEENGEKMVTMAKAPFHSMFKYADRTDVLLMLVGMVGALGNGMSMVIMTIIFGQMIDAFGGGTPDTIVPRVSKVWL